MGDEGADWRLLIAGRVWVSPIAPKAADPGVHTSAGDA
jgi:hypothetical protein